MCYLGSQNTPLRANHWSAHLCLRVRVCRNVHEAWLCRLGYDWHLSDDVKRGIKQGSGAPCTCTATNSLGLRGMRILNTNLKFLLEYFRSVDLMDNWNMDMQETGFHSSPSLIPFVFSSLKKAPVVLYRVSKAFQVKLQTRDVPS